MTKDNGKDYSYIKHKAQLGSGELFISITYPKTNSDKSNESDKSDDRKKMIN